MSESMSVFSSFGCVRICIFDLDRVRTNVRNPRISVQIFVRRTQGNTASRKNIPLTYKHQSIAVARVPILVDDGYSRLQNDVYFKGTYDSRTKRIL